MTLEEFKTRLSPILDAALEGNVHEDTESFFQEIQQDYLDFSENSGDPWKQKFMELKEKYVRRFINGTEEEIQDEVKEEPEEENKEEEKIEEIEIKDILKEVQ